MTISDAKGIKYDLPLGTATQGHLAQDVPYFLEPFFFLVNPELVLILQVISSLYNQFFLPMHSSMGHSFENTVETKSTMKTIRKSV